MTRFVLNSLFILFSISSLAQSLCNNPDTTFAVLHFTKTTGFDHNTRAQSGQMFQDLGNTRGYTVTNTNDANVFNDIDTLRKYAVIVFSNTSGNSVFNASQRANFEQYMNEGGSYLGIHAASDTYRTGWPFYNNIVGAIVQSNPNHTSANHVNTMDHMTPHPILNNIPSPWTKEEEYYYWDINGGMIDTLNFRTLLRVRQTGSNSYDRSRPMAWYRQFPSGARSFYTALGHKRINYETPGNEFRQLVDNAVCWLAYDQETVTINSNGLTLNQGSVILDNQDGGIILKSANGSCFKIVVDNFGVLTTVPTSCN